MPTTAAISVEQQLRQERDRFIAFAFCGNDMLMELDAEGRIRFAAGATELLAGAAGSALLGRPFIDLVADADRPIVGALVAAAAQGGKRFDDAPFVLTPPGRDAVKVEATGFTVPQLKGNCFLAVRRARQPKVVAAPPVAPSQSPAAEVLAARQLLESRKFDIAFQPVVSLDTGAFHHLEALLRLPSGQSPAQFIHLAEANGFIADLDLAITKETVSRLITVAEKGRPTSVAINLSGRSLSAPGFAARLNEVLSVRRTLSQLVILEITDSGAITDLRAVNEFIQSMRTTGFKVTLDDFGARGAAFEQLRQMEVDYVKIDGSFIREARKSDRGKPFVIAMTGLCRALGVTAIAEQVEDPATIDFLRECGVSYGQGYLFGRPMADADLLVGESMSQIRWRRSNAEIMSYYGSERA
ncbi:MAG: EAL domain-containing protein [Alphaproteobacteria bacterium]|nr:EAL domain-containing protein [Alphaproteobacteria bacterium]